MRNHLLISRSLLLALAMLVTGCGKSGDSSSSSSSSGATAAPADAKSVKLVYIAKNTGNPYFDPLIEGARQAAQECGAQFETVSPATADATSQLPLIKDQMQRGMNVIMLSPNSPDALVPVLHEAIRRGITVITVDSDVTGNESCRTAAVATVDPKTVGESQVELVGSLINYQGKIAILSATTDAPNQNEWIGHMKKTLESNPKYKAMQLVDVVYGNDEPQKSLTEAEALLTKYPDLRGIIAPTTVGVAAAAQCVESAKKADQVKVTGLGTPNQMRRFIKNGTVQAFALWSPHDEGYLAGQLGVQLATKKITAQPGTKFTAGSLGEREFRADNVVITGPPVTFTKDNIDQFNF